MVHDLAGRVRYVKCSGAGKRPTAELTQLWQRCPIEDMTELTRQQSADPHRMGWDVFYGNVKIGWFGERAGVPADADRWGWTCGFYPGWRSRPSRSRHHQLLPWAYRAQDPWPERRLL
ncbi:hypothetical protein HAP48_0026495 [Bradyrhizobium septentrionale]|uniref:Uncharacterized protein n=1 Tax=Bradyrhizobium septentrionale TaxID=1404411 RepID=A0A973VXV8_9BRAD|nr:MULTISPECIES: hypothetical protein [Bradyrhizobium]UGY12269.1 hypothetical protein HAP48_0026495 [Bradyrhizobium septentrionale]UGY25615.1 hypothetical protein HU675_0001630 [Bradyrhizobium septentrionale]